jgi:hypothetical protein
MNNEANLFLDESKPMTQIREDVIAALQAGDDFVVILVKEGRDEAHDLEIKTTLDLDDLRVCVDRVAEDARHLRRSMNN